MTRGLTDGEGLLSPYRVLDLTDERGEMAGMMLGDLGADVIRVEPPGGSAGRFNGPHAVDVAAPESSLQFLAYNRNKRSIVLDLGADADRDALLSLVASADFVLESFPGSPLTDAGLGFDEFRGVNPALVHVQISPYGTTGPAANWPANDLTIAALGGPVALQGDPEGTPIRLSVPQVWRHTGAEAAVAALMGHARMRQTGEAQLVDVSAQCAMTWTLLNSMDAAGIQGFDFQRIGEEILLGQITLPIVFPCADGYVIAFPTGMQMPAIVDWMMEDDIVDESWRDHDWMGYQVQLFRGECDKDVMSAFRQLFSRHSKREIFQRGLAIGATFAPVNTVADILEFNQLRARDFWHETTLPNGNVVSAQGVFAKPSVSPLSIRRPAPGLDEHGVEIREELARKPGAAKRPPGDAGKSLPLEGLKVADFSWIGVGPITGRCLADHGATVVRVESELRPDGLRGGLPFLNGEPGWNRSQFFGDFNTSKLGLLLNLKSPEAIEIAKKLIAWADVYIESFTPGTVDGLGIGYSVAKELNPGIVMASTCLMGQTGPAASIAGYGYHAGAMAGFYEVAGWPGKTPTGPWVAYTDTIAPRFLITTLLAAIDHQRRTGEGQLIDGAQLEMGLQLLAPELLEYQDSGYVATRMGNRSRFAAPQGVYRCTGDDNWCAIAVDTDEEWQALRAVLGNPDWAGDPALDRAEGRLARHDLLDERIAAWTLEQDRFAVAARLVEAGVPAGAVQRTSDLLRDEQYRHRGFYRYLEHKEMGRIPYAGHQFQMRGYSSGPRMPSPVLGEHSFEVLTELLGLSEEEVGEAFASGAIA